MSTKSITDHMTRQRLIDEIGWATRRISALNEQLMGDSSDLSADRIRSQIDNLEDVIFDNKQTLQKLGLDKSF